MMARWLSVIMLVLLVLPTWAVRFLTDGDVTIPAGQVIDDDVVATGGNVRVLGEITGDLLAAAGNVDVDGRIGGNLTAAAGNVNVRGPVGGAIYATAGTLNIISTVGRNVVAAVGTLSTSAESSVGRDLAVSAGNATVAGTIARDLLVQGGSLTLTDTARVGNDLVATAGSFSIADGAVIQGERVTRRAEDRDGRRGGLGILGWILWQLATALALLVVGLIFVAAAPRLTEETQSMLRAHPWASLLTGLIVLLITPLLFILLLVTVIGIPLALILLALYLIAIYIAPIFAAIWIGRLILRRREGRLMLGLLIGIGILFVLKLIPFLGFLVTLAALLFGLGALLLAIQARSAHPLFAPKAR